MKRIILFGLLVFIGAMLFAGYDSGKFQFGSTGTHVSDSQRTPATTGTTAIISYGEVLQGHLEVSIGNYGATLPVFVDNITVGNASSGAPLDVSAGEGVHIVKVCDGGACSQTDVRITSGIKTAVDFSELLAKKITERSISVSLGSYISGSLPVFIDNAAVGEVSSGKPLNLTVNEGSHTVRVCAGRICENETVDVQSSQTSPVDFGARLARDVPEGTLSVSIGGYNADGLPVSIDTIAVGNVSIGKALTLMVGEGSHTVEVCMGLVCENESIVLQFGHVSSIDFGERLKRDAEFPEPTVRIVESLLSGSAYAVNVEFINPDITDHTMTATIGSGYTYIESQSEPRKSDFAKTTVSQFVKGGSRQTQQVTLYLTMGSYPIASEPTVTDVTIE